MIVLLLVILVVLILFFKVDEYERRKKRIQQLILKHEEEHRRLKISPSNGSIQDDPINCPTCKKSWDNHFKANDDSNEDLENEIQSLRDELGM